MAYQKYNIFLVLHIGWEYSIDGNNHWVPYENNDHDCRRRLYIRKRKNTVRYCSDYIIINQWYGFRSIQKDGNTPLAPSRVLSTAHTTNTMSSGEGENFVRWHPKMLFNSINCPCSISKGKEISVSCFGAANR